ncbi:MAG: DUF1028 domain-containing protein [Actinomycetota bacterium]
MSRPVAAPGPAPASPPPSPSSRRRKRGRRLRRSSTAIAVCVAVLLGLAGPADATWSIVAVDPESGEVGAAIASCVDGAILGEPTQTLVPVVLVPAVGAGVSQGQLDAGAPRRIGDLLNLGTEPEAIVVALTDLEADPLAEVRQHAVVTLDGPEVAAHTGTELNPAALDRQGETVSVQGNLLVDDAVVDDTQAAFEAARDEGAPLAGALVAALQAGADAGGDLRCEDQTALFAQVAVAGDGDDPVRPSILLTVLVADGDGTNPVDELSAAWAEGRRGLLDMAEPPDGTGPWFRIVVFVVAAAMILGAYVAWSRGIGSRAARRSTRS